MNKKIILSIGLIIILLIGCTNSTNNGENVNSNKASQVVMLGVNRQGYTPAEINLEYGKPVTFRNDGSLAGCSKYLLQPELGINANFAQNNEYTFTPNKKGEFILTCNMGMVPGKIVVR